MGKSLTNIIDFTLVYNQNKKQLFNYIRKMLDEKSMAEDITQNVFLKLYENLKNINKAQSVVSWLYTTARNEVYGYLRRKKIKSEDYIDENIQYSSNDNLNIELENIEIRSIIENEIVNMEEETKEIFILRHYSELSYGEIGNILGLNESLVKGRLFRARQKLIDKVSKLVR